MRTGHSSTRSWTAHSRDTSGTTCSPRGSSISQVRLGWRGPSPAPSILTGWGAGDPVDLAVLELWNCGRCKVRQVLCHESLEGTYSTITAVAAGRFWCLKGPTWPLASPCRTCPTGVGRVPRSWRRSRRPVVVFPRADEVRRARGNIIHRETAEVQKTSQLWLLRLYLGVFLTLFNGFVHF